MSVLHKLVFSFIPSLIYNLYNVRYATYTCSNIYLKSTKCYTYDKERVKKHSFGFCGVYYLMGWIGIKDLCRLMQNYNYYNVTKKNYMKL